MSKDKIYELERQVAILKKKLERSEQSRVLIEQAKDHYDLVYRSNINRLAEHKALLDAQNQELDKIHEELLIKNSELLKARKSAERGNEAKSKFLATMSHEIRTPINGVLGFLELLEMTDLNDEQSKYVNEAIQASEILIYLINDILDFSKIESEQMTIESISFNLHEIIHNTVAINRPKAFKKNIQLQCLLDAELPKYVIGDPTRLQQVFNNLIGNAVKFTDEGRVKVTVGVLEQKNDTCILDFQVEDTGIGMDNFMLEILFTPFKQGDSTITRRYGGTGLGLVISKQLLELMGSDLRVTSELHKGSCFSFKLELPLANKPAPANEPTPDLAIKTMEPTKDFNILLAEDNATNVLLIQLMLKKVGLTCDVATNGLIAVEAVKQKNYDLILMDCQMPEMDGYEASKIIKTMPGKVPTIIAMTANAFPEDREKCFASGMDEYMPKPISLEKLFNRLNHYITTSQLIENHEHYMHKQDSYAFDDPIQIATHLARELDVEVNEILVMVHSLLKKMNVGSIAIADALQVRDVSKLLAILHNFSGLSGNLQMLSLNKLIIDMSHAVKNNDWSASELKFEELKKYLKKIETCLQSS